MRILDRLVTGQFLRLFVIGVLATPPLFILGDFTEKIDNFAAQDVKGWEILHGYLYRIPEFVVWAFPVAGLIAAVFTVHTMTQHREIVAAKAGGISFRRLTLPIVLAGALLAAAAVGLTEVAPRTTRIANEIHQNMNMSLDFRSDFVFRTESGYTLSAKRLTMYGPQLSGIELHHEGKDGHPSTILTAGEAEHVPGAGWTFLDGRLRLVRPDGTSGEYQFGKMKLPTFTEQPKDL